MPSCDAPFKDLRVQITALKKLRRQTDGAFITNSGSVEDEVGTFIKRLETAIERFERDRAVQIREAVNGFRKH